MSTTKGIIKKKDKSKINSEDMEMEMMERRDACVSHLKCFVHYTTHLSVEKTMFLPVMGEANKGA
jgi:hypothetical protein